MKLGFVFLATLLGMVDQIEDDYAVAEVTAPNGTLVLIELPLAIFPCEIAEGDFFYIKKVNEVTEVRCGEPPPE